MDTYQPHFPSVDDLLENSRPGPRPNFFWLGVLGFAVVVTVSSLVTRSVPGGSAIVSALSGLMMVVVMGGMGLLTWSAARAIQQEQTRLDGAEELIQLRRFGDAAVALESMLSQPTRTPQARVQALIYLASVLARFHRFADAIVVYESLLRDELLDATSAHGLRLGRAMSILREDRLFDADRAINELRRGERADESAGLALVELYREVKTGHLREAVELFAARRELMRRDLSHRVGDAWALVARAHDLLEEHERAAAAWYNATALVPAGELARRYPEVASLTNRYAAAVRPAGGTL